MKKQLPYGVLIFDQKLWISTQIFDDRFRYNVDEIEEKPKTVFSALCNRWLSITGVSRT